jgi:hypothetical protein
MAYVADDFPLPSFDPFLIPGRLRRPIYAAEFPHEIANAIPQFPAADEVHKIPAHAGTLLLEP